MKNESTFDALSLVLGEIDSIAPQLTGDTEAALALLSGSPRVFVHGAGRSGLALRMTAMRLMHLGLEVHVVGEVTTPAIRSDDVLLVASGSGTTSGIVQAARTANDVGARVLAISATAESPLAELSSVTLVLPAAVKTDRSRTASQQYAGSLFEQGVVLLGDAMFHALWVRSGRSADDLWPHHANLE